MWIDRSRRFRNGALIPSIRATDYVSQEWLDRLRSRGRAFELKEMGEHSRPPFLVLENDLGFQLKHSLSGALQRKSTLCRMYPSDWISKRRVKVILDVKKALT